MTELAMTRLRLANRCLVAAGDADQDLFLDPSWQRAVTSVTTLIQRQSNGVDRSTKLKELRQILTAIPRKENGMRIKVREREKVAA